MVQDGKIGGTMAKTKDTKQSDRETLIAYISTLSDKKCKEAYQILLERFEIHRARCLTFNREGIETKPPEGKIRLTPNEFDRVLNEYGEQGFHELCEILYDYIVNLEERAVSEVVARTRLKNYQKISHYYKLTKGWVAQRYTEAHPELAIINENPPLSFGLIKTKGQAIEYIKSIPNELRFDNPEIVYLVQAYGIQDYEIN